MLHSQGNYTFQHFHAHLKIKVESHIHNVQVINSKVNLITKTNLVKT